MLNLLEGNLGSFDDEESVLIKVFENKLVFDMHQPGDLPGGTFELYQQRESENPAKLWPVVGIARMLSHSFSISDAHPLIALWMNECKSKHSECAWDAKPCLPTRLIAVGPDNKDPYLYETQPNETGRYIALSHCWGPPEHPPPRTISLNLGLRKDTIPMNDLPQTFADAVQLCRALEIDYLWIDSLCIVQDDTADWEREAAAMADVYRNAVLTFSADGAVDSSVGLFQPVNKRRHPASIKTCCPAALDAEPEHLYGRMTDLYVNLDRIFGVHTAGDSSAEDTEPLSRRAWTFQEWILSRRIVHFATGELLWDCLTAEGCECQVHFKPRASPSGVRRRGLTDNLEHWGMRDKGWSWGMMVSNFTSRQLTYHSDKLPALSGVAKYLAAERVDDYYIAGHWTSELPISLLWRREIRLGSDFSIHRLEKYHAPSWSWASTIGPVLCENVSRGKVICDLVDVSYKLASINPYGPLSCGFLKIKGIVANIPDCVDIVDVERLPTTRRRSIYISFIKDDWQPGKEIFSDDVVFLALRSCWDARKHELDWDGLALRAVGGSQDRFARIGVLSLAIKNRTRAQKLWQKTHSEAKSEEILMTTLGAVEKTITIV